VEEDSVEEGSEEEDLEEEDSEEVDEDDDDEDDHDLSMENKRRTNQDESSDYDSDSDSDSDSDVSKDQDDDDSGNAPDAAPSGGTYVPPALRAKMGGAGQPSEEEQRLRNRVRGLINRLSDNNKTAIGKEILDVFRDHPVSPWCSDNTVSSLLCVAGLNG
jgi:hypothetical protein